MICKWVYIIGNSGTHCPIDFTLSDPKGDWRPILPPQRVSQVPDYLYWIQSVLGLSQVLPIPYYNAMNNNTQGWILYKPTAFFSSYKHLKIGNTCASATYIIRRLKSDHAEEISWKISGLLNLRKPLYRRKETLTFETQFDHVNVIPFIW